MPAGSTLMPTRAGSNRAGMLLAVLRDLLVRENTWGWRQKDEGSRSCCRGGSGR